MYSNCRFDGWFVQKTLACVSNQQVHVWKAWARGRLRRHFGCNKGIKFWRYIWSIYVITFLFSKSETGLLFKSMTQLLAHSYSHGYVYHQPIKWRASLAIFDCCCCWLWTKFHSPSLAALGWTLQHLNSLVGPRWTSVQSLEFLDVLSLSMYSERFRKRFQQRSSERPVLFGTLFSGSHMHAGFGLRQCRQAASIKAKDVQKELKKETQELRQSTKSRKACDNMSSRVLCCFLLGCRGVLYRFYASLFFSTTYSYTCMPCCRPGVLPKARVVEVDEFPTDWASVVITQNSVVTVSLRVCRGVSQWKRCWK